MVYVSLILCNTNSSFLTSWERCTIYWMNQHAFGKHIQRSFLAPVLKTIPIDALMWSAEVSQWDSLVLAPAHG